MNDWASHFNCPIYIHQKDEQWIYNKGKQVCLWTGTEHKLWDDITIINLGGHFPGSSILHVPFLSAKGTILCRDSFFISPSRNHIAVMYSYPNKIPLPIKEINRIKNQMELIEFDTMCGFYDYQNMNGNAKLILQESLNRYVSGLLKSIEVTSSGIASFKELHNNFLNNYRVAEI